MYSRRVGAGNTEANVAQGLHLSSRLAGHPNDRYPKLLGAFARGEDIWAVATGGIDNEHASVATISFNLPGENLIESIVVANGCQASVGSAKCDGGRAHAFHQEPANKLTGNVLGIGSGATISGEKNRLALCNRIENDLRSAVYITGELSQQVQNFLMLNKTSIEDGATIHVRIA